MDHHRLDVTRFRLGVIGPQELVDRTVGLAPAFPALELTGRPYGDEREAPDLLTHLASGVEAVLFTGPVPYRLAMAHGEPPVPAFVVPLKGTGLYRALFLAGESTDLERVAVDTLTEGEVAETYGELGLSTAHLLCADARTNLDRQALVRFHLNAFRAGRTTASLTGLHSVARELKAAGVPCIWVTPTTADLKAALDRAMLTGANLRQGQAVVGLVSVDPDERAATEHQLLRLRHEVCGLLLSFVEQFDGHLLAPGAHEYQFFATREPFERSTGALSQAAVLDALRQVTGGRVSMGVGMGRTANEAGTHARIALRRAREETGSVAYVVLENRRLLGPMGSGAAVASDLRSVDPALLAVAGAAGMSAPAADRLFAALQNLPTFTAADIAEKLGVSLRSAHRLVANLEKAGAISAAGQEKLVSAGRPRTVYRLTPTEGRLSP